jgi:succinate-acetate transporter protein
MSTTTADIEAQKSSPRAVAAYEHRTIGNPAPLGLLAFAQALFLISLFGVHPKGVTTPNVLISRCVTKREMTTI